MTNRPALLIMQRHLAPLTAFLESEYTVYRFWEGPPPEAQGQIRAEQSGADTILHFNTNRNLGNSEMTILVLNTDATLFSSDDFAF
jgi:hypothetical protein